MLDEQTVLPCQEARDSEVDPDGVVLNIHAAAGTDVIVGKLRDERVGRFIEIRVLKLNIAQARSSGRPSPTASESGRRTGTISSSRTTPAG